MITKREREIKLAGFHFFFSKRVSVRVCGLYPFKAPISKINLLNGYQVQLSIRLRAAVGSL